MLLTIASICLMMPLIAAVQSAAGRRSSRRATSDLNTLIAHPANLAVCVHRRQSHDDDDAGVYIRAHAARFPESLPHTPYICCSPFVVATALPHNVRHGPISSLRHSLPICAAAATQIAAAILLFTLPASTVETPILFRSSIQGLVVRMWGHDGRRPRFGRRVCLDDVGRGRLDRTARSMRGARARRSRPF